MLPRWAMEAYLRFLLNFRWSILAVLTLMTIFLGWQSWKMRVYTNFFDLYPS